jgi:hypothetical protein
VLAVFGEPAKVFGRSSNAGLLSVGRELTCISAPRRYRQQAGSAQVSGSLAASAEARSTAAYIPNCFSRSDLAKSDELRWSLGIGLVPLSCGSPSDAHPEPF